MLRIGIYDFVYNDECVASSKERKLFLVGFFPLDSDPSFLQLYSKAHTELQKKFPDLVSVKVSTSHLSTAVAWREKKSKHFVFNKYFSLVLGLLKSRISEKIN